MSAGDSAGDCDPVAGTLASGAPELCSVGVGVKWTPLLVDKGSVFVPSQVRVGLVVSCSLGSVETFLGSRDVCTDDTVTGITELLGVPLVGEAGGLCGELVQRAVVGVIFVGRETGKRTCVGMLCTLSPVEEPVQKWLIHENLRGKAVLQHLHRSFSFYIVPSQL